VHAKIGSEPRTNRWKVREFVVADPDVGATMRTELLRFNDAVAALSSLMDAAYSDIKARVEHG